VVQQAAVAPVQHGHTAAQQDGDVLGQLPAAAAAAVPRHLRARPAAARCCWADFLVVAGPASTCALLAATG
jgi:hypothetical protein